MSAWIRQLDALGGGCGDADSEDDGSYRDVDIDLPRAIRRALAREAAAGAPLA